MRSGSRASASQAGRQTDRRTDNAAVASAALPSLRSTGECKRRLIAQNRGGTDPVCPAHFFPVFRNAKRGAWCIRMADLEHLKR